MQWKKLAGANTIFILFCFSLLTSSASAAKPRDYFSTLVTRDYSGFQNKTYEQYIAENPVQPFKSALIARNPSGLDDPLPFVIIVDTGFYPQIQTSVAEYIADLAQDGYSGVLYTAQGGTPANLKDSILIPEWEAGAVGALLIGNLPVPWFELYEDFDNDGIPDDPWMVEFPCDLFYMDVDGIWQDTDLNGIYDVHEGNWFPDLWIGQLPVHNMTGNQVGMAQNYFAKNHAYRMGNLFLPDMALAYIDDDWAGGGPEWADAVAQAWANTTLINDINTTAAQDYINRWDDNYQHILLASHSSPTLHSLKENNGTTWGDVFNWQIIANDPHFLFYNLFACSNCRYVETDYCGGAYLFNDTYGILAVGSTKTGSMLFFEDYYEPLSAGVNFGEALRHWLILHANEPNAQMWSRSWFYGMTNLGDPTLKLSPGIELISYSVIDDSSGSTCGDGDGIADNGETIETPILLYNSSNSDYNTVYLLVTESDQYIELLNNGAYVPIIPAGDSVWVPGITMLLNEETPDSYSVDMGVEIGDISGYVWYDSYKLLIRAPKIELVNYDWREIAGNGNGILDAGETIGLTFDLKNFGGQECQKFSPGLVSPQGCIQDTMIEGIYNFPCDSMVEVGEIVTQFYFFPQGRAGLAMFFFEEPLEESVFEMFYLPGGNSVNIYNPCEDLNTVLTYPVNFDFSNQWGREGEIYNSPLYSFRFGSGEEYAPQSDGALELPLIKLLDNTSLTFSHQYDIEEGYDGGVVEIWQGEGWEVIEPSGGYPGISVNNGSYPGGPCFNGTISEWAQPVFPLSNYNGSIKLRFRFGSDGGVEGAGWYLDDILVNDELQVVERIPGSNLPDKFTLFPNYPNPWNSSTEIGFFLPQNGMVKMAIYNLLGREVAVLVNSYLREGSHRYRLEAGNLSSGIYFYQIEYKGDRLRGKSVLLK